MYCMYKFSMHVSVFRVKFEEQETPVVRRSKRIQEKASHSAATGIGAGELKSALHLRSPVVLVSKLTSTKVLTRTNEKVLSTKHKPKQSATSPAVNSVSVANCSTDIQLQPKTRKNYRLRARKGVLSSTKPSR